MASLLATITAFALFFLLVVSDFSTASAKGGFTVELIHRDSPRSPFYNSSESPSQRVKNALRRSITRVHHFINPTKANASSSAAYPNEGAEATIINNGGEYLMELSIGTPPVPIKAIADTGSDLIWTQCKPCADCYKQTDPLFDPSKSSTYKTIPCSSTQCTDLQGTCPSGGGSGSTSSPCQYQVTYGDQSHTVGDVAADTLTLASTSGRNVSLPTTIIGCGHDNKGTFDQKGSGIVGLGGGDESLITQMSSSIDGKFSYCLVPLASAGDKSSKLSFGDNAVVSGSDVVSTPIVVDQTRKTFYFLTLEAISVDDTKIPFTSSSSSGGGEGNVIIDSGTTLTMLERSFYQNVEDAVDKSVVGGERVSDPQSSIPLCYKVGSQSQDLKAPNITVHFTGADVSLESKNTFIRTSTDTVCFTFAPSDSVSIYGNLAQAGFLVGYDLQGNTLSFKPTDCTKA